jgi:chromosomal replication initiation ATPase DnaA
VKVNWKLYEDTEADKFAFLVRIVAEVFSVTPEQILCRSRFARWVEPRQLVATIWSENHSLQETGYRLDRHHGAIIHARERVRFLIEHDDRFADKVRECLQRLVNEATPENEETPKEKIA